MDSQKIIAEAMRELKMADVYAEMASQSRCKARKLLESVVPNGSPAPKGGKKQGIGKAVEIQLTAQRRKHLLRKAVQK